MVVGGWSLRSDPIGGELMKNTFFAGAIAVGAVLGVFLSSVSALAVTFDFRTGNATVFSGGTLAQSGTTFLGAHIPIDILEVVGSANGTDGVYNVDGPIAILHNGTPTGNTAASLDFATNGSLMLFGSVPGLGLNANSNLIESGSFGSFSHVFPDLLAITGADT